MWLQLFLEILESVTPFIFFVFAATFYFQCELQCELPVLVELFTSVGDYSAQLCVLLCYFWLALHSCYSTLGL